MLVFAFPVTSGAVIGVMRQVGLVGPKLAFQIRDEQRLAEQLAERAQIDCRLPTGIGFPNLCRTM